ncbi:uncharacterized protein [Drosophila tropicalis]|uniref:uncharacterized protein n=1 Tax=Drosophila tropicalis TaxID=46794 RepID=UPI0035ABA451
MIHNILLTLTASIVPILALIFVAGLFTYKLYIYIRCRYNATVNCWFCNENSRVPYEERNSFTCPKCEQYNGFTKDGDYNRDMFMQRDTSKCSNNSSSSKSVYYTSTAAAAAGAVSSASAAPPLTNGLCDQCNEAQRLKVEKLAQFEPKHESRFEQELTVYRNQLEEQFRLCSSCERHVDRVLHEKKKMVLGSKFLNFIIKGAALLKQPHFNRLARVQQQRKLQRYQFLMVLLSICNVVAIVCGLPIAQREQFNAVLGHHLASPVFFCYSHVLTLVRVVGTILEDQPSVGKLLLYGRTFGKLILYSVGLSQLQVQHATLASCYTDLYPYAILILSFLHNVSDGLKFTRFTLLLLLWSVFANGSSIANFETGGTVFNLLGSALTLVLLFTNRRNLFSKASILNEESAGDSFHRLCADECISDEETISMLSQQLNCSAGSNSSMGGMTSLMSTSGGNDTVRQRSLNHAFSRAPSVLSLNSLHLSSQRNGFGGLRRPQPTASYAAGSVDQLGGWRSNYAPSPDPYINNQWPPRHQHQQPMLGANPLLSPRNPAAPSTYRSVEKLLMPPRLLTIPKNIDHGGGHDVNAWLAASSNQELQNDPTSTTGLLQTSLSRTSSQSSGFESQPRPESQANSYAFASAPAPPPRIICHLMTTAGKRMLL